MRALAAAVASSFILIGCPQDLIVLDAGHRTDRGEGRDAAAIDVASIDAAAHPDASTPVDTGSRDATTGDSGATDLGAMTGDAGACADDPFTPCDDPAESGSRHDEVGSPDYFTGGGCLHQDGTVVERDFMQDAVLCSAEPGDFYAANFVGCTNVAVAVIATVEPLAPCDHDDWDLRVYRQRTEIVCGSGISCMLDGNKKIVRFLLDQDFSTLQDFRFGVIRTESGVEVPYRLRVQAF